jgi:hypothetical protein
VVGVAFAGKAAPFTVTPRQTMGWSADRTRRGFTTRRDVLRTVDVDPVGTRRPIDRHLIPGLLCPDDLRRRPVRGGDGNAITVTLRHA